MTTTRRTQALQGLLSGALLAALAVPAAAQDPVKEGDQKREKAEKLKPVDAGMKKHDQKRDEKRDEQRATSGSEMDRMFQRMFDRMEHRFGIHVPRHSFFRSDFLQDLRKQLEQTDPMTDLQGFEGPGRAMAMEIDEDGVRVRISKKDESGKVQTKKYEAESLQAFREKFPDVSRQLNLGQRPRPMPDIGWRPLSPSTFELVPRSSLPEASDTPEGERLGVLVRSALSADLREFLDLEEGQGLMVTRVFEDTLAARLGIQRSDIILEINGRSIGSPSDVRQALAGIEGGETVEACVNRRGKKMKLKAGKAEPRRAGEGEDGNAGRRP